MDYQEFLEGDDVMGALTADFVRNEVAPRVAKVVEEFGDGWLEMDLIDGEIHTRELSALLMFVEGKLQATQAKE